MKTEEILAEITKARELEAAFFDRYLHVKSKDEVKAYKYILTNQRKNLEQLIQMYRDAQDEPEQDEWDNRRRDADDNF